MNSKVALMILGKLLAVRGWAVWVLPLVTGCWLAASGPALAAQQLSLRFLGSDFTVWQSILVRQPSRDDPNARALIFNAPPSFPTDFAGQTNATESWGGLPTTHEFPDDSMAVNNWPQLTNSFGINCGNGAQSSSRTLVEMDVHLWPMAADATVDDALQVPLDWWPTAGIKGEVFSSSDFEITFQITGGEFDGKTVKLPAAVASAALLDPGSSALTQYAEGDLFLAVDWGVDLLTNREFLIFHFSMHTEALGAPQCPPLPVLCQQWFGAPDVASHLQKMSNDLINQLSHGDAYLQGGVPDLVFLYDFSGDRTVQPFATVSRFGGFPPVVDFSLINQYDAGGEFGLPTAASDGRPGGNACGPLSLTMAMNAAGVDEPLVDQVYANTMQDPPAKGTDNKFQWLRARAWLEGKRSFKINDVDTPFPDPRAGALPADNIEATGMSTL